MRSTSKSLLAFFVVLFMTTAAFSQVKSDYDKDTDFSKYKSYTIEGWQKDSDKILTDFDKKRIMDAMESEFSSRGLSLVQSGGDAALTLYIVVKQETSTTAYTTFNGGFGYAGRWGWGMGAGMGMGSANTTYTNNDYQVGTFVIDMYDATSKKLVWQGVITSDVEAKPEKRAKTIPSKMKKLMKSYPVKPTK